MLLSTSNRILSSNCQLPFLSYRAYSFTATGSWTRMYSARQVRSTGVQYATVPMTSLIHPWASHVHALKRRHPGRPVLSEPGTFISWPSRDGWWRTVVNSSGLIGSSSVKARLQVMIISTSTPDGYVQVAAVEFSWSRFSSCWPYSFVRRAYETEGILPVLPSLMRVEFTCLHTATHLACISVKVMMQRQTASSLVCSRTVSWGLNYESGLKR